MNQDYSKAVSFVNSYFTLADGLVTGLENYLAENVILDWFGKTIKGRTNVTAFLNTHKVNSRHVFEEITPTDSIGYNKKTNRRRRRSNREKVYNSAFYSNGNVSIENQSTPQSSPLNLSSGDRSRSASKIDREGNSVDESDLTLELQDDALSTIFKLENIQATNIEEIEEQINKISLEDVSGVNSPSKKECKEENRSESIDALQSSMQYIEADGELLFSKKSKRQSCWNDCKLISSSSTHTWRKPCKLQIAYSSQKVCVQNVLSSNNNTIKTDSSLNLFDSSQHQLLTLDEITKLSNNLVPNVNDYAGYLRSIDYTKAENTFFKNLDDYFSKTEGNRLGLSPRYINNQLVFQNVKDNNECSLQHNFIFNHSIRVIIYEGKSRCRRNLSQKFS